MGHGPIKDVIIECYPQKKGVGQTEKQILAKSYSKMMKNIGDELRHIGPHSLKQHQM